MCRLTLVSACILHVEMYVPNVFINIKSVKVQQWLGCSSMYAEVSHRTLFYSFRSLPSGMACLLTSATINVAFVNGTNCVLGGTRLLLSKLSEFYICFAICIYTFNA